MPLYEYECGSCRNRTEVIQRFSDAPLETCSDCGGALRKLVSSPAIQFKGSGFYITDYSRGSQKSSSSSETSSSSDAGSASSTTSGGGEAKAS